MQYRELITLVRALFARDVYTLGLSASMPPRRTREQGKVRLRLLQLYDHCPEIRTRIKSILDKLDREGQKWKR